MNSLGVDPYVNNIYTDTCNGVILIQVTNVCLVFTQTKGQ